MKHEAAQLRNYSIFAGSALILTLGFGIITIILYFNPALVGVPHDQFTDFLGHPIWLVVGILFISFGIFGLLYVVQWWRRLLWVYHNVEPDQMTVRLEIEDSGDSTDYYAILSELKTLTDEWRVRLYFRPRSGVKELTAGGVETRVFVDPKTQRPIVMETAFGILWAMGGSGAVYRLN